MSHIFDALHKSVAEQSGTDLPSSVAAIDLLQATESKIAAERAADSSGLPASETAVHRELLSDRPAPTLVRTPAEVPAPSKAGENGISVDQLSQFPSLKVLVLPESGLVCITDKESLAAEKFRFLGVRLRQLRQSRPLKKVLITSTIPGEGKSMVAANLACTLARRTHQKTLLLDGDLRRPSQAQLFGLGKVPGMCEWLQAERGPINNIYHLEGTGLWILPAGSTPRNPLELMQSGGLSALMDQLTTWFDWIVIDSPPMLPLADTSVWMRSADGILLVTRQGITEKQQLQRGLEAIEQSKLIGALLNCSTTTAHNNYYYHYGSPTASQPETHSEK